MRVYSFAVCLVFAANIYSQSITIGPVLNWDLYQMYRNPHSEKSGDERSSGSALNLGLGVKTWIGKNNFSVSLEALADLGILGLDVNGFKGLGMVGFPMACKLNFGAMSGFSKTKIFGWSIGGGIQYNKTELYGLNSDNDHLERTLFPTYFGELGVGGGFMGANIVYFVRYGQGEHNAVSLNTGFNIEFNPSLFRTMKKVKSGVNKETPKEM